MIDPLLGALVRRVIDRTPPAWKSRACATVKWSLALLRKHHEYVVQWCQEVHSTTFGPLTAGVPSIEVIFRQVPLPRPERSTSQSRHITAQLGIAAVGHTPDEAVLDRVAAIRPKACLEASQVRLQLPLGSRSGIVPGMLSWP